MEFDAGRRQLIEAVLEPIEARGDARATLEVAAAWASELGRQEAIKDATDRMLVSAEAFKRATRKTSLAMTSGLLLVLWLSLLRPAARDAFSAAELSGRALCYMAAMDEIQGPPVLLQDGFRLPSITTVPPEATWREMYERQKVRMGGKGTILDPLFSRSFSQFGANWRDAWERSPADPALYFRAACAEGYDRSTGGRRWPADLVATGEKLDPDNGMFRLCHAAEIAGQAVSRGISPGSFAVDDSIKLEEAMEELEKASALPRWDDYRQQLSHRESIDWPAARDYPEQVFSVLTFRKAVPVYVWPSWNVAGLIPGWVETAAANPDPAALEQVERRFTALCRRWAAIETGPSGRDLQKDWVQAGAESLATAFSARGERAREARYATVLAAMKRFDIAYDPGEIHAYGLLDLRTMQFGEPSSGPGKQAGRMAEYAMWERISFHFAAILLALLGGILLLVPRFAVQDAGLLPVRLTGLLKGRDRALIILAGSLIPMAVYFGCTRLLPGREEYISLWKFLLMLSQAFGMIWAMLFGSAALARWLLIRRGAALGFRLGHLRMDLLFAVMVLALIPAACFTPRVLEPLNQEPYEGGVASLIMALPLLWAGFRVYGWSAVPPAQRLLHAALMRACAPAICTGAVLATAAIFALHAWESRLVATWTAGSALTPELLSATPAQQQRAEEIRQAILTTLDP